MFILEQQEELQPIEIEEIHDVIKMVGLRETSGQIGKTREKMSQ